MDVMVGPWDALFSEWISDASHHDWAMDAQFSECIRPWTSSWLGPECFVLRTG